MPSLTYNLPGLQVEPAASLWLDNTTHIRVPSIENVKEFSEPKQNPKPRLALNFATDFPFDPANPNTGELDRQLDILPGLAANRAVEPYPAAVTTPQGKSFPLTPLSRFIHLQPVRSVLFSTSANAPKLLFKTFSNNIRESSARTA